MRHVVVVNWHRGEWIDCPNCHRPVHDDDATFGNDGVMYCRHCLPDDLLFKLWKSLRTSRLVSSDGP